MAITSKLEVLAGIAVAFALACGLIYWRGHHVGYASAQAADAAKVQKCADANALNAAAIDQLKAANAQFANAAHDAQEAAAAAVKQQAADAKANAAKLASAQQKLRAAESVNQAWASDPVPPAVQSALIEGQK